MINYGIVIVLFVIVQALSSTGNLSRLLMGLLVPLCVYTIASVSLNLVVTTETKYRNTDDHTEQCCNCRTYKDCKDKARNLRNGVCSNL